nr:hypothetical protein [Tanacetum cinerariifolium]
MKKEIWQGGRGMVCADRRSKNPYEPISQAYLVGTDTESELFEDLVKTETLELPYVLAPPTCHVEESEGFGTSGARSTSSDSTAPLLPDHLLTHTTPVLRWKLCLIHRSVRGLGLLTIVHHHRPFQSRIGIEVEGPTTEDEDLATGDEGLAARDEGPGMGVESHGLDDESRSLDDEGHTIESDGFGLGKEKAILGGPGSGFAPEPERSERVSASRQHTLATWTDPEDGMVYIDVLAYPSPAPPAQIPPSPEWSSGLFPISPAPSIVPSPMISLTVLSPIALVVATSTAIIPVDEDQFIEERIAMTFVALWRPVLALEAWAGPTALQRELLEMGGRVTVLEQERDRKER